MDNTNYIIGKELKKIRKEKGLSIEYIANFCNISTSHLNNIENGNRGLSIDSLELHLNSLNISNVEFFNRIKNK